MADADGRRRDRRGGVRRWWRILGYAVLLPPALVIVFVEDVLWAWCRNLLRALWTAWPLRMLTAWLARLPAPLAVLLFLLPEGASRLGTLWAALLLIKGHLLIAGVVYVAFKLVATLTAVLIWQACAPRLLSVRWFARLHAVALAAVVWTHERLAPLRLRLHGWLRRGAFRSWRGLRGWLRLLRQRFGTAFGR